MTEITQPDRQFVQQLASLNSATFEQMAAWLVGPSSNPNWYDPPTALDDEGHFVSLNIGSQKDKSVIVRRTPPFHMLPRLQSLSLSSSNVQLGAVDVSECRLGYLFLNYLTRVRRVTLGPWLGTIHVSSLRHLEELDLSVVRAAPLVVEVLKSIPGARVICTELQRVCAPLLQKKRSATVLETTTEELLVFMRHYNWDGGLVPLRWIISRPRTPRSIALRTYWMNRPEWYVQYARDRDVPDHAREGLLLKKAIEKHYLGGLYTEDGPPFDPRDDEGTDWTRTYPELEVRRPLPAVMYEAVK